MARLKEANIEIPVCAFAQEQGWFCRKNEWVGRRGAPDRVFSHPDHGPLWVEFKRPGAKPRVQQVREIARMQAAGMRVHVIDNVEDGYDLFR